MAPFLFGAGASVDAGMSDSSGLLSEFVMRLQRNAGLMRATEKILPGLLADIGARAEQDAALLPQADRQDIRLNIQHLVDELREPVGVLSGAPVMAGDLLKFAMRTIDDGLRLESSRRAVYFRALIVLARALGRPVHVFTLNFDPCVESIASPGVHVETGFGGRGLRFVWDMDRFLHPRGPIVVLLYKLHGSLDWRKTKDGRIYTAVPEDTSGIEDAVVVLGHESKRRGEFPEPYERYRERFLEIARNERQVIIVGYGFGDFGINEMLSGFANSGARDRITVVTKVGNEADRAWQESLARSVLDGATNVRFLWMSAKNLSRSYRVAAAGFGAVGLGGWLHRRLGLAGAAGARRGEGRP